MSDRDPAQIVEQYLKEVEDHLQDLPDGERGELLADLRAHIVETVGNIENASEVEVLNALERMGTADELAAETRERKAQEPGEDSLARRYAREQRKAPGALEIAAIVLTALIWPIGVVLAWASDRWRTRDKVIATAIPFTTTLVFAAIVIGGFGIAGLVAWSDSTTVVPAYTAEPQGSGVVEEEVRSPTLVSRVTDGGAITRMIVAIGFVAGIVAGPFVTAVYLASRLRPIEQTSESLDKNGYQGRFVAGGHI